MHARKGLRTPYLSKDWFDRCRTAARQAKEYGMQAWIYDEDGWPSGFAGGLVNGRGEEYCCKYFNFTEKRPEGSAAARVIAAFCRTEAAAAESAESGESRIGNTAVKAPAAGEKTAYVRCAPDAPTASLWAVYEIEPNYADVLSKKTMRAFIDVTYERYKQELGEYFGTTVPGFFTDEPQYNGQGFPFSLELSDYFYERNGFRMENELYRLQPSMTDEESAQYRIVFWETVQAMMRENFSKQIGDWCAENHVIFTGHYPGEDSLLQQLSCTAGVMPKYEYMQMPGIDHLGRRITSLLLVKQVGSAAKQNGQKKILSETFGCAGWNLPFREMCYIWAWQALQGINVPVLHIGAYSMAGIRKRDYPAFFSYQEPWWDCFGHMSAWMSGLSAAMAWGRWTEKVLVVSPMESIYALHSAGVRSQREKSICASYRLLCDNLTDIQVGFDLGDETMMAEKGTAEKGRLRIGRCSYELVIVAETERLKESTWELLRRFKEQGGTVVFTESVPEQRPVKAIAAENAGTEQAAGAGEEKIREVQNAQATQNADWTGTCPVICNVRRFWQKYFQSIRFARPLTIYEDNGFRLAGNLNVAIKEDNGVYHAALMNMCRDSVRELKLAVPGRYSVRRLEPENLSAQELPEAEVYGREETTVPLRLHKEEILLLELTPTAQAAESAADNMGKQAEEETGVPTILCGGSGFAQAAGGSAAFAEAQGLQGGKSGLAQATAVVREYDCAFARTAENALTLDYARYAFDDGAYSEEMPVIRIQDLIYRDPQARGAKRLRLRYTFDSELTASAGVCAVIENRRCEDILCNGTSIRERESGWYLDHGFGRFALGEFCRRGENTIEIVYTLGDDSVKDIEGLFETERNRFFYPVEPESIYLLGDFDVRTAAPWSRELTHLRVGDGKERPRFVLAAAAAKRSGELTEQGLWFYRSNAKATLRIDKAQGEKVALQFTQVQAACVEVHTALGSRVCYAEPFTVDLTELLSDGENEAELILHGTNRNLLGAHHHIQGEDLMISEDSFKGIKGGVDDFFHYEMDGPDTWTDDYSFVPFGCGRIRVIGKAERRD